MTSYRTNSGNFVFQSEITVKKMSIGLAEICTNAREWCTASQFASLFASLFPALLACSSNTVGCE